MGTAGCCPRAGLWLVPSRVHGPMQILQTVLLLLPAHLQHIRWGIVVGRDFPTHTHQCPLAHSSHLYHHPGTCLGVRGTGTPPFNPLGA